MNPVEMIDRLYLCFKNEDWTGFKSLCHETLEWRQNEGFPGGGLYVGAEAVIDQVFSRLSREWEGFAFEREEIFPSADGVRVVVLGHYTGRHGVSKISLKAAAAHVFDLSNGRIQRFRQYTDTACFWSAMPPEKED